MAGTGLTPDRNDAMTVTTHLLVFLGATLGLGAGTTSVFAQEEAAPTAAPAVGQRPLGDIPGLETNAGPPAWVQPGLRLTYHRMSGTLSGHPRSCRLGPRGQWSGPDGQTAAGRGSAGYLQANIIGLNEKEAAAQLVFFLFDGLDTSAPLNKLETGYLASASTGGDLWLHPDALAQLAEQEHGEMVSRVTKEIDGTAYDALQIVNLAERGKGVWVYDLASGVLLYSSQLSASRDRYGQPETEVHFNTFKASRQLEIPWTNEPPPPWLANVQRISFQGQFRVDQQGVAPSGGMGFQLGLEVLKRGADWLHFKVTTPNDPPAGLSDTNLRVSGNRQLCGLWIPPTGLAKLRAGQTIDTDPLTRVVTTVSGVDGQHVVFTLASPRQSAQLTYRRDHGMLAHALVRDSLGVPGMSNVIELRLTDVK